MATPSCFTSRSRRIASATSRNVQTLPAQNAAVSIHIAGTEPPHLFPPLGRQLVGLRWVVFVEDQQRAEPSVDKSMDEVGNGVVLSSRHPHRGHQGQIGVSAGPAQGVPGGRACSAV